MTPTTQKKSPKTRNPEATRARILHSAQEIFMEKGFTGARTSQIAKKAGVASGLIFHYFSNKEVLFQKVMENAFSPYFESLLNLLSKPPHQDLALLEESIRSYFYFLKENPHVPGLLAWWWADKSRQGIPMGKNAAMGESVELLGAQRIREGQEAGFIRSDLDPALVIKTFTDMCMMWFLSKEDVQEQNSLPEDCDAADDHYLNHLIEVFMGGIST